MKAKIFVLCMAVPTIFYQPESFASDPKSNVTERSGYSIVFGATYQTTKENWTGTLHNELLYPWFYTGVRAEKKLEYRRLFENARKNGVRFIGYYYSATNSYGAESNPGAWRFPEPAIPPEDVKSTWILRDHKNQPATWPDRKDIYFLDVELPEVQDAILNRAIRNAKALGCDVIFLDNWYYKFWSPKDTTQEQWTKKCMVFLARARELTARENLRLVVNTPSPPVNWPEFAGYVDGIAYELGALLDRLRSRAAYKQELDAYEKVLSTGTSVFLYTDRLTNKGKRWDADGRKVAATAMLVVFEGQLDWGGMYVCPPHFEVWPVGGWPMWPQQLGKPLGPRTWNGDTVGRKFEHGIISVTVGDTPKFSVSFEY